MISLLTLNQIYKKLKLRKRDNLKKEIFIVEEIVKSKGLKLIKKYGLYYIRFIGGQHEEYPCDLLINDEEALSIISNNNEIKSSLNFIKRKLIGIKITL